MALYSLRFEIRKDVTNKKGEHPISSIISVSQQRKRISTELVIPSTNWDKENQKAFYLNKKDCIKHYPDLEHGCLPMENDIKDINRALEEFKNEIEDITDGFDLNGIVYSSEMISKAYLKKKKPKTKKEEPSKYVFDFIDEYIETNKPSRATGSLKVYSQLKNHLLAFHNQTNEKVRFENIGYGFFQQFENFLIEHRGINNVTIAKQLSTLKTFLGYARKNGISVNDTYRDFAIKRHKMEVIALTEAEYRSIKELDLTGKPRLEKARDIFIFLCATSMRYSDYWQFKREHIKGETIKLTMKKTKKAWEIPLNMDSHGILEKYKELHEPLPKMSNPKLSEYIKEVCQEAKINEIIEIVRYKGAEPIRTPYPKYDLISAHTGRKTFCTLSLERGAPAETVMKWSGHESYASFKRYIHLSRQHNIKEMANIWGIPTIMKAI